jgi:NAD(P)H-dependent FMN reductase
MGQLPLFNPDDDVEGAPPPAVAALRATLADAGAVLVCTPEYAGALPGALKNLLEWTVGGVELTGKPVAWINAAGPAAPSGGAHAHDALRRVLGYVSAAIVEEACLRLPVTSAMVGADGEIHDAAARAGIARSVAALAAHAAA